MTALFSVLYEGVIYGCTEITDEASLYCAASCYGSGDELWLLEPLGHHVRAKECKRINKGNVNMDSQQMTDVEFWKELGSLSPEQCLCVQAMVESGFTKEEALKVVKDFAAQNGKTQQNDGEPNV